MGWPALVRRASLCSEHQDAVRPIQLVNLRDRNEPGSGDVFWHFEEFGRLIGVSPRF